MCKEISGSCRKLVKICAISNSIESLSPCSAAEPPGLTVNSMKKKKKKKRRGNTWQEKLQALTTFKMSLQT